MEKGRYYCYKICCNGDRFQKEDGSREFFNKDYKIHGEVFAYVELLTNGSYRLIKVVNLPR